jgi:hypothetical protein
VDAGQPPKEPNRVATRVVPTIYPKAMQVVCNKEQAQENLNFVPRSLARQKPENIPQGEHTLLMQPQPLAKVHPFTPTLKEWQHGIPVDCSPDWNWDVITATVNHGPHPTAQTQDSIALFKEDINYQVKVGFCKVYLWDNPTENSASKPEDLPSSRRPTSGPPWLDHPRSIVPGVSGTQWRCHHHSRKHE